MDFKKLKIRYYLVTLVVLSSTNKSTETIRRLEVKILYVYKGPFE
jgi:hypothetical protein